MNMAVNYYDLGKYDEARTSLIEALNIDPIDPRVNFNLGKVEFKLGNTDTAVKYFSKSIFNFNASSLSLLTLNLILTPKPKLVKKACFYYTTYQPQLKLFCRDA